MRGRLIVSQRTDDQPRVLSDQSIELPPGKRVFTLREQIDQPNFYNYEARFVPDDPTQEKEEARIRQTIPKGVREFESHRFGQVKGIDGSFESHLA